MPFIILALMVVALAAVSFLPDAERIYTSPVFVAGWAVLAAWSLCVIVRRRLYVRPAVFMLHISFLVILAGALVTHCCGTSEKVHLRVGDTVFVGALPVTLDEFVVEYYPGTQAPSDFVSHITVDGTKETVAMNKVVTADGYRFYQSGYDADSLGSVLTVTHDPWGIGVTYSGYLMLLVSMIWICVPEKRRKTVAAVVAVIGFCSPALNAAPSVVPADVAERFGNLFVYHNGRVAPFSSLARDFTVRLTGSATYRGMNPEQVLSGWLFYYDSWKDEPCIYIKGVASDGGDRASLADFFDESGRYRFSDMGHEEENEKFSLASMASAGSLWKIFPYTGSGNMVWYSPVDDMPDAMDVDSWRMARHSLGYVAELVAVGDWEGVARTVDKIASYQHVVVPEVLPSAARTWAERMFVDLSASSWPAAVMVVAAVALFFCPCRRVAWAAVGLSAGYVLFLISLNAVAAGRVPMANGYETMQWMAVGACVAAALGARRTPELLALGLMVAGLSLMVAMIGLRNPQVTQIMPVLRSPLLSVHVLAVMLAYALLALMALCGVAWLFGRRHLLAESRRMLRPAVFLLAAGIFIGAVWANMSWGRYWGWDPKEVWALITMLVYSLPLHRRSLSWLADDRAYAIWCVAAFTCVVMTYFGVNFILGGLHSYA